MLRFTSGISGEFGEGGSFAGSFPVPGGQEARLIGRGSDWVLIWEADPPCVQRTVGGNGFRRSQFVRLLRDLGLIPPPPD